jgi:vacuolar-type H+-ATPase subunit E/Vma4
MSLDVILEAIEATGEAEAARQHAETEARVQQILAEATRVAATRREDRRRDTLLPAAGERSRRLHQARLEALRTTGAARERLVEEVLAETRRRLASIRADLDYPAILCRLTEEAVAVLGDEIADGSQPHLEADPRDEALLRRILSQLGLRITVTTPLACWGGVIVKSGSGQIVATNTLEARLERATPFLRRELAALMESQLLRQGVLHG